MPTQTTYTARQPVGFPGQLVNGEEFNARSATVETAGGIPFGLPVARGAAEKGCVLMAAGLDFIGVTRRSTAIRPTVGTNGDRFGQYQEAGLVDMGVIWGTADRAVAAGADANYNTATNRWTDAAVAGGIIAIPGVEFDSATASAGDLVKLRVRRKATA